MTSLQEYDLEIKPTKLVKGQGLCKLATKTLDLHDYEEGIEKYECLMVLFYLVGLNNGRYFNFEEQEENCRDLGASQRKGEPDIH